MSTIKIGDDLVTINDDSKKKKRLKKNKKNQ